MTKRVGMSQLCGGVSQLAQASKLSIRNSCFSVELSLAPPSFPPRVLPTSFTSPRRQSPQQLFFGKADDANGSMGFSERPRGLEQ
ncbi:hypothetical protein QYF36_002303 [Acer negundo]|nr:hypothetical protein QYF36_002303 [Acer negundo]